MTMLRRFDLGEALIGGPPPSFDPRFASPLPPKPPARGSTKSPVILGLAGPIGSGKSTVAEILEREHGFARTRFARPLKMMLRALLLAANEGADRIERMVEGDLKEVPCDVLAGVTPRRAMQTLGGEWGRDLMGEGLWAAIWTAHVATLVGYGRGRLLVEDLRYPNEAAAVRALGGRVLMLSRPGHEPGAHSSEKFEFEPDGIILNDGTLADLTWTVAAIAEG